MHLIQFTLIIVEELACIDWSCGQTSLSGLELNWLYPRDSKQSVFLSALYILSHSKTMHVADVIFSAKTHFELTCHGDWKCPWLHFIVPFLTDYIRFIVSSASAIWQEHPTEFLCEFVTEKLPSDSWIFYWSPAHINFKCTLAAICPEHTCENVWKSLMKYYFFLTSAAIHSSL